MTTLPIPPLVYAPATDTREMPRVLPDLTATRDLGLLDFPPPVPTRYERPRWSWLARALAVLVAVDIAGLLYAAVTWW